MAHVTMHEELEAKAKAWIEGGQQSHKLPRDFELFLTICWRNSPGGRNTEKSDDLQTYLQASYAQNGDRDGWGTLMRRRDECERCNEGYRLGNLSMCTGCRRTFCYRCARPEGKHENGNLRCRCGGEIVG